MDIKTAINLVKSGPDVLSSQALWAKKRLAQAYGYFGDLPNHCFYIYKEKRLKVLETQQELGVEYPVCPFCKIEMRPVNYSHYYSEGSFAIWLCNCDLHKNATEQHDGY